MRAVIVRGSVRMCAKQLVYSSCASKRGKKNPQILMCQHCRKLPERDTSEENQVTCAIVCLKFLNMTNDDKSFEHTGFLKGRPFKNVRSKMKKNQKI